MVEVNLKSLVARLNRFCTRSLEGSAGLCISRTQYEVTPEHLLSTMADDPTADLQAIFKYFNGGAAKDFCARVFGCLEEGFIEKKSRNADCLEGQRRARLF